MKRLLLLIISLTIVLMSTAQPADQQATSAARELTDTIARMDSKIFDAFNAHNVDMLMSMFADDVEFYHDSGGLTNFQQTKEGFTKMFASSPDIRRDLVRESLEVYPIKDYGAIEIGVHRFYHKENGKEEIGSFKFVNVWRKTATRGKFHASSASDISALLIRLLSEVCAISSGHECNLESRTESHATSATQSARASRRLCGAGAHSR